MRFDPALPAGQVFCTFHGPDPLVKRPTSPVRDRLVYAPESTLIAVERDTLSGEASKN
ncbi:hypothetical protein [Burkholderia sp. SCN-KJ]|uniref:hypothetical protein n=1 Tax=Burkholderia sp. SCN-KJ TaxID=2969248 RepID=UPI00214FBEF6|nr:hypothetical protein [Burkholderia sp. SCN-KJ]MCR4468261.1 hypothetical protein [Burkholderia sp. SCN-KJ]